HRPRVRSYDGHEVALPTWTAAQGEDWLGRWAMNLMLINVSTRKLRSFLQRRGYRRPTKTLPRLPESMMFHPCFKWAARIGRQLPTRSAFLPRLLLSPRSDSHIVRYWLSDRRSHRYHSHILEEPGSDYGPSSLP